MYLKREMACSSVSQPFVMHLAILTRFEIPGQTGREQSFTYSVMEALDVSRFFFFKQHFNQVDVLFSHQVHYTLHDESK